MKVHSVNLLSPETGIATECPHSLFPSPYTTMVSFMILRMRVYGVVLIEYSRIGRITGTVTSYYSQIGRRKKTVVVKNK